MTTDVWLGIKGDDVSGGPLRRTLDVVRGTSMLSTLSVVSSIFCQSRDRRGILSPSNVTGRAGVPTNAVIYL